MPSVLSGRQLILDRTKVLLTERLDKLSLRELEGAERLLGYVVNFFREEEWIKDTTMATVFDSDGHSTTKCCAIGWINRVGRDLDEMDFPKYVSAERVSYMAFAVNTLLDEAFVQSLLINPRLNRGLIIETDRSVHAEAAWLVTTYNDAPERKWNQVHEMFKNAFDSVNNRIKEKRRLAEFTPGPGFYRPGFWRGFSRLFEAFASIVLD